MNPWVNALVISLTLFVVMLTNGAALIYMLRKVLGHAHLRLGPTELGPAGVAQLIPDILKLLTKEDRHPNRTDRWLYILAPVIIFIPSYVAYAFIPFSSKLVAANVDLGLLMLLAFTTLVPLGIFAAGWGSHNKYSLLGSIRAIGAALAYEIPLVLAGLTPVMLAGSMNLVEIVEAQASGLWFGIVAFPMLIVFFIAALMELGIAPFDMPESESELVAGFSSEYSAMRFGLIFVAEFSNNFIMAGLLVTLFLGGWTLPFIPAEYLDVLGPFIFILKTYFIIFLFFMVRGNATRFRIDQIMAFGWKRLLPFTIVWSLLLALVLTVIRTMGGGA